MDGFAIGEGEYGLAKFKIPDRRELLTRAMAKKHAISKILEYWIHYYINKPTMFLRYVVYPDCQSDRLFSLSKHAYESHPTIIG